MNSSTIYPHKCPCWHTNVSWREFFSSASFPFSSDFSQSYDALSTTLYLGVLMYMVALILASSLLSCRISKLLSFRLHLACSSTLFIHRLFFLRYFPSNSSNLCFEPVGISCLHSDTISRN